MGVIAVGRGRRAGREGKGGGGHRHVQGTGREGKGRERGGRRLRTGTKSGVHKGNGRQRSSGK
eukprot:12404466-Prorocentrum_lima.AAC.1